MSREPVRIGILPSLDRVIWQLRERRRYDMAVRCGGGASRAPHDPVTRRQVRLAPGQVAAMHLASPLRPVGVLVDDGALLPWHESRIVCRLGPLFGEVRCPRLSVTSVPLDRVGCWRRRRVRTGLGD
jgi:hypothetical protein